MEICSSQGILDAMIIAEVSDSDTAKDDKGDLMMRHSWSRHSCQASA